MDNNNFYKTTDLFGNEQINFIKKKSTKCKTLFDNYEGFVDKFKQKKTTDDCFTPKEVMDTVIDYVNEKYPLAGKQIIRPFFPGGDFESVDYPDNCVVIDNPPFSILSKICRFYIERNIKFFLFCPHLTAFSSDIDVTHIITGAAITYENGAVVKTSFVSNMFGDVKILGDAELHDKLKRIQKRDNKTLPKYQYPDNIITVSKVAYCVEKGVNVTFFKDDLKYCRAMDAQKMHGVTLFGSGFLASNKAAAEMVAAAEKAAAKKAAAATENVITWELSQREKEIIKSLGKSH